MELSFEKWCNEKKFSERVKSLFGESFVCYKNAAYRASFLFSYLAFLTHIKETIMRYKKPSIIDEVTWNRIIKGLQDDRGWENTLLGALNNKSTSSIFAIPQKDETLRNQITYWRDVRNDCAHSKSDGIEACHTEVFWSFIKNNLSKIVLIEGMDSLLNKFEEHYDRDLTPSHADITPLVSEIDTIVKETELSEFWVKLFKRIIKRDLQYKTDDSLSYKTDITELILKIFENSSEATTINLATFFKNKKLDLHILRLYPQAINNFCYTAKEIRKIWRTRIFEQNIKQCALKNYVTLLCHNCIPNDEIKDANRHFIDNVVDCQPIDDETTHIVLNNNSFGEQMYEKIKENRLSNWSGWVNPKINLIMYYIEKYPLKDEVVEIICEIHNKLYYSWKLRDRLKEMFANNALKKQEFSLITERLNIKIPDVLIGNSTT